MSKLLQDVKRAAEKKACREHNEKAGIKINGDKITYTTCCENFKSELLELTKKEIAISAKKQILDAFK